MKPKLIFLIVILVFSTSSHAIKCGRALVQVGDHEREVLQKCGTPIDHEEIGYTKSINGDRRVFKIEESYYKINGRTYLFRFEGNELTKIDRVD